MQIWVINLIVLWIAQFCASSGFQLSLPFAPYYIQTLGVHDPLEVKFWTTVVTATAPLSMAFFAPIWGSLADRYGRKNMILRATFGAGLALGFMSFAPNVYVFVAFRILQGIFTGVSTANITLVSCNTPQHRTGFALSCLSVAEFSGQMTGLFVGGILAAKVGYANAFLCSSCTLAISGVLVLLLVRESFTPTVSANSGKPSFKERFRSLGPGVFLLILVLGMSITRRMDGGMLAIYVQELYGKLDGVSIWSSYVNAAGSLGALCSGLTGSFIVDRFNPRRLMILIAMGAAGGMMLLGSATTNIQLIPFRFMVMLFVAAFDPVLNTWLSRETAQGKKGTIFGFSQMAKSCGMTLGPCLGGTIASIFCTRAVFWCASVMFLCLIPLVFAVSRIVAGAEQRQSAIKA